MKIYYPNFAILGRYFDGQFCAKTDKEAAERIGCSLYHLKTYVNRRRLEKKETEFKEFWVKPHCYNAKKDLGEVTGWMTKEQAEEKLREVIKEKQKEWK